MEKKPLVGLVLDPDLLQEPDADRADERERQARHPADHDRRERPDEQQRELELGEADDGREEHAGEPGEHHADHPRPGGDRLGVHARDRRRCAGGRRSCASPGRST